MHTYLRTLTLLALVPTVTLATACGGSSKKPVTTTGTSEPSKPGKVVKPKETEEDRAAHRLAEAQRLIPEGTSCLPAAVKEVADGGLRLELAGIGDDAVVCAVDAEADRALGPVACWTVALDSGNVTYRAPAPMPGHNVLAKIAAGCAWGYCPPSSANAKEGDKAALSWSTDGTHVAALINDSVYIFDDAKKLTGTIKPGDEAHGDKKLGNAPVAIYFVGDTVYVEGADAGPASYLAAFKIDGPAVGMITDTAKVPANINTYHGSVSVLDVGRIAISDLGMQNLTIVEVADGKKSRLARKYAKGSCKPAEITAYGTDGTVSPKCKTALDKAFAHLSGASVVAGGKNFLTLLRGPRLGELVVLDAKTLAEKKSLKMPWCPADADATN